MLCLTLAQEIAFVIILEWEDRFDNCEIRSSKSKVLLFSGQ